MPTTSDVAEIIDRAKKDMSHRTLILIDHLVGDYPVYGKFDHPYDASEEGYFSPYFGLTKTLLSHADESVIFTEATLPIVRYVNKTKIPILIRDRSGSRLYDGETNSPSRFIGLGV